MIKYGKTQSTGRFDLLLNVLIGSFWKLEEVIISARKPVRKKLYSTIRATNARKKEGLAGDFPYVNYPVAGHGFFSKDQPDGNGQTGNEGKVFPAGQKSAWDFFQVAVDKRYGDQVQKAMDKTLQSEFGASIFAGAVGPPLFPPILLKPFHLAIRGMLAVHFPVNVDVFDHLLGVGLQTAVEVMQSDPGNEPGDGG